MPRVTLIQQVFNSRGWVPLVYDAMANQTYKDIGIIAQVVADDGGAKDYIAEHYPRVKIIEPGYNIGFAKGHNEIFASMSSEFYQLVNPDLILEPDFVEQILKAFDDPRVGSASGKLLRYDFAHRQKTDIIDSTGLLVYKSSNARTRGAHQVDTGQFDRQVEIIGPDGAGAMYRQAALEAVKYPRISGRFEYFDEDFHSYWEDVDLALRLANDGWQSRFVPGAIAYHGRTAAVSKGGYKKVFAFIKHHRQHSLRIRMFSYRNRIYTYIKNIPRWHWSFFLREFFYQGYVLVLETSTLKVLPSFFRGLKIMFAKRKFIQAQRKIPAAELERLLM